MKVSSILRERRGAGRPRVGTVSTNHKVVKVQLDINASDQRRKSETLSPTDSSTKLPEELIQALEALGVYEDRGTDSKDILFTQTPDEEPADFMGEEEVLYVAAPESPPVTLLRPKRRSRSRSSLLSRDNSVKRSPLSQREDGRHEPVFFGHQCRVRGCEFAASSLQHIKHHEQTSSHRGLRRKHEEDVNPFLSEEEIF